MTKCQYCRLGKRKEFQVRRKIPWKSFCLTITSTLRKHWKCPIPQNCNLEHLLHLSSSLIPSFYIPRTLSPPPLLPLQEITFRTPLIRNSLLPLSWYYHWTLPPSPPPHPLQGALNSSLLLHSNIQLSPGGPSNRNSKPPPFLIIGRLNFCLVIGTVNLAEVTWTQQD